MGEILKERADEFVELAGYAYKRKRSLKCLTQS
jgi:hypothetical protein